MILVEDLVKEELEVMIKLLTVSKGSMIFHKLNILRMMAAVLR